MVEVILFLDDSVSAFTDGFEGFIDSEEHNDSEFISVVTAEKAEKEGEDEHNSAAEEAGVEII